MYRALQIILAFIVFIPRMTLALDAAIIFVHEDTNDMIHSKAIKVALEDLIKVHKVNGINEESLNVTARGKVPKIVLDALCDAMDQALGSKKSPLMLDMTAGGVGSETTKSFSATLAIPTVTTSYGKQGDIKAWHVISPEEEGYLVQISTPADIMMELIPAVVGYQKLTNIAILFADEFAPAFKVNYGQELLNELQVRSITRVISGDVKNQLRELYNNLEYRNFFITASSDTIENVLNEANDLRYLSKSVWYVAMMENSYSPNPDFDGNIIFIYPKPNDENLERLLHVVSREDLNEHPMIDGAFYYDVAIRAVMASEAMSKAGTYPAVDSFSTCDAFSRNNMKPLNNCNLRKAMSEVDLPWTYAPIIYGRNGHSYMEFDTVVEKRTFSKNSDSVSTEVIGSWKAGFNNPLQVKDGSMEKIEAKPKYRVVTKVQPPFVTKTSKGYEGLCIDLLVNLSKALNFEYTIYEVADGKMGYIDDNGEWSGIVSDLMEKKADFAITAISIMVERERVIDFTMPFYDAVGISILMKKSVIQTSLFKFLTVLEVDVWLCILAAYFLTSFLMWVFDRWSPYSYQNNKEKYKDDEEKRIFDLKECLWFCMTSLTPQGGGEAPKNLSGRLVAATWWLFGFIIMASYTANLAAFLTVSRLDTPIESLDDLSKQYKIRYAPENGSSEMNYFQRMSAIENKFYDIWKDMSLNDSLSALERSKLAVWDYPVSDKYTKMWQAMTEAGLPSSYEDALERVRNSKSSSEGFALLGDGAENMYQYHSSCDFQIVGEEFSRKPYAIALQQGSHLREQFNTELQKIINQGGLVFAKEKWWKKVSIRDKCDELNEEQNGISIRNIGGVFIVICMGIGLAIVTLTFEYLWYQFRRGKGQPMHGNSTKAWPDTSNNSNSDVARYKSKFLDARQLDGDHAIRRPNAGSYNNYYNW